MNVMPSNIYMDAKEHVQQIRVAVDTLEETVASSGDSTDVCNRDAEENPLAVQKRRGKLAAEKHR